MGVKLLPPLDLGAFQRDAPIPSSLDLAIHSFILQWSSLDQTTRELERSNFSIELKETLGASCVRLVTHGVRSSNSAFLWTSLLALGIGGEGLDIRDMMLDLAPVLDGALRIGVDPQEMFSEAASFFTGNVSDVFSTFPSRPKESTSLEAMGWIVVEDIDGIRYQYKGYEYTRKQDVSILTKLLDRLKMS